MNTNVLIIGMPKSGTTALYASVKQAQRYELTISEISNRQQFDYFQQHQGPRLGKVLLPRFFRMKATIVSREQAVLIARDPRDIVISSLLFRPFLHDNFLNQEFMTDFVDRIRKKEQDPPSVSVQDLLAVCHSHGLFYEQPEYYSRTFRRGNRLMDRYPNLATVRYEDFVVGNTAELEAHLGFPVTRTELAEYNRHNQRAKGSGSWRHWFTPEDVAVYRPIFDPYLEKWGYGADDWDLSDKPRIDPKTSSEHIIRNMQRLQASPPSRGTLLRRELYDAARIDMLKGAADDRREPSMIELALAYRDGYGVEADPAHGVALLREAAMLGNARAMVHLSLALRHGVGTDKDHAAADRMVDSAAEVIGDHTAGRLSHQARASWWRASKRSKRGSVLRNLVSNR